MKQAADVYKRQLFGGGHAELRLSNEEDPLSSNIDIVAQPPGKDVYKRQGQRKNSDRCRC